MSILSHRGFVHVGMDVSRDWISVASLAPNSNTTLAEKIPAQDDAVRKLIKKLGRPSGLWVCYEAGPTGYGLYRLCRELGVRCDVVAPSLIPKGPGDRVKTDKRDARRLMGLWEEGAKLHQ